MGFDPLITYYAASDLLSCAAERVALTDTGIPDGMRIGVVPGDVAMDNCCDGMLVATIGNAVPSTQFPLPDLTEPFCGVTLYTVDITVWIVRCAPVMSPAGAPPTVEQLDSAARVMYADERAVWTGMNCCLAAFRDVGISAMMRGQQHYGPEGGCMGSQTTAILGFVDPCECEPVILHATGLIVDSIVTG